MPDLAEVFRRYGPAYLHAFGDRMPPSHRRAMEDIVACRTPVLGGELYRCDHCGRFHFVYHSCRNRHCPTCHGAASEEWLGHRRQELLPGPYFHLVFTIPAALHSLLRGHPEVFYSLLMRCAAEALKRLAADPKYVGGQLGILALLHTWGRNLHYHPHVHCLVPAGGLDQADHWHPARPKFLVPVRALSALFRALFCQAAARAIASFHLPRPLRARQWVVYSKPALAGPDAVLSYLGRYIHRVAITNRRIVSIEDGKVTFTYTPSGESQCRSMTLPAQEFIRRFLQHVLPRGLHKVRYYGPWASSNRQRLRSLQAVLLADPTLPPIPPAPAHPPRTWAGAPCPYCQVGHLRYVRRLHHHGRLFLPPRGPP